MRRTGWFTAAVVAAALYSSAASAGVWFETLYSPCLSGNSNNISPSGAYIGSFDCFNNDFNGAGARTTLSIKAFQVWEYGTMFLYYDITDPWNSPVTRMVTGNELGGFFGGITVTISPKRVAEKIMGHEIKIPFLRDIELKYELENVSKFGSLNYYGIQWSIDQPFLDFLTVTTVIRDDLSFEAVDLQLGAAWQKSFSLGPTDWQFGGFVAWGVFGEGNHVTPIGMFDLPHGHPFMVAQPQLLLDVGKLVQFSPAKIYLGVEWQFAFNRYLIPAKSEHVLQYMLKWNI
ncbi:MAG TPA: hypothetical protein VIG99_07600 [Myxococcaceae bacterium]